MNLLLATVLTSSAFLEETMDLLKQAQKAWMDGNRTEAVALAGKAIAIDVKNPRPYLFRAQLHEAMRKHAEAIADCDTCLKLDAKVPLAYDLRGSEQFKLGNVAESIADFDKAIELNPEIAHEHWKRGISLYYVG